MKKTYQAPKLVNLGTVADLTQVGTTNAGSDAKQGSINPRGHDR